MLDEHTLHRKDKLYSQCRLRRGTTERTSWIPAKFAAEGRTLRLMHNDEWSDGWVVVSCGTPDIHTVTPEQASRLFKRRTGDIASRPRDRIL